MKAMPRSAPKLAVLVFAAIVLGSTGASAWVLVSSGNGGWTVIVGGDNRDKVHEQFHPHTTFSNKTTADRAARYLTDMETAAANNDKGAYAHAVSNFKALLEIAKQQDDAAAKTGIPLYVHLQQEAEIELGPVGPNETLDAYYKRVGEKIKEELAADPQANATYTNYVQAGSDYLELLDLEVTYESRIWALGEVLRLEKAAQTRTNGNQPSGNSGGVSYDFNNPLATGTLRQPNPRCDANCLNALVQSLGSGSTVTGGAYQSPGSPSGCGEPLNGCNFGPGIPSIFIPRLNTAPASAPDKGSSSSTSRQFNVGFPFGGSHGEHWTSDNAHRTIPTNIQPIQTTSRPMLTGSPSLDVTQPSLSNNRPLVTDPTIGTNGRANFPGGKSN